MKLDMYVWNNVLLNFIKIFMENNVLLVIQPASTAIKKMMLVDVLYVVLILITVALSYTDRGIQVCANLIVVMDSQKA